MLKLAQEGSDNEKIALLQSLLEDANRRTSELETENRSAHRLHWCLLEGVFLKVFTFVSDGLLSSSGWSISV